jgi:glycerol kinase
VDLVLALDAGTTGVRAVAFDDDARPVDLAYRELTQHFPAPGEVEHDPVEIARLAIETLSELAHRVRERGDSVAAIGVTNQRETTIGFDRADGASAHRALVWQDRRTTALCEQLERDGHLPLVRERTGLVLDPYFSGTKMRWLCEHGALDHAAEPALCTVDAYLVWTLSGGPDGGVFATEPSNASRTMLLDLATLDWSVELGHAVGVDLALLPEVRPSAGRFASVSAGAVPALAGVPITGVLGDQQAALFGQACFEPGMVKATYGTGAFILANVGASLPPVRDGLVGTVAWDLGAFGAAHYALEGSAFVAGAAIQWLRDELGILDRASDLEPLARRVPDSGGVCFVPAFTGLGSPFWRPEARGSLTGLTRGSSAAHVARAVLEAQAHQVRAMTDTFSAAGVELRELRADGGAAAMDLLLEQQATGSRLTVRRSSTLEATARGAATIAGLAAGVWDSLDELAGSWRSSATFTPGDPAAGDALYAAWRRAVERA